MKLSELLLKTDQSFNVRLVSEDPRKTYRMGCTPVEFYNRTVKFIHFKTTDSYVEVALDEHDGEHEFDIQDGLIMEITLGD